MVSTPRLAALTAERERQVALARPRWEQIKALRTQGATYAKIGAALGISAQMAHRLYKKALRAKPA